MRKDFYKYNESTLSYEKVKFTWKERLLESGKFIGLVLFTSFLLMVFTRNFFPSAQEMSLIREIEQMEAKYASLNHDLDLMEKVVENIHDRDGAAHRMIFGMDPIDDDVWRGGTGGHDRNSDIVNYQKSGLLLSNTQRKIDKLKFQLTLQSKSLDTIYNLAKNREEMFASIPSIKPVSEDKLSRKVKYLSGYGMRLHPIHKVRKMHAGIDFTAKRGTPIQATGNGKVIRVENRKSGYGKNVTIDHGYGYKTLYAHMYTIDVKKGDKVTKGQKIGTVGSTGTSTAPHCHYEVHYMGKKVNPIHYCMDGLTPTEYKELVDASAAQNQSFD